MKSKQQTLRRDMAESSERVLYREVQHFRQVWLWAFLLAIALLGIFAAVQQLIWGRPFGSNPASDVVLVVIVVVFSLAFPAFFYLMNLTTEVRSDGLYLRFFPFHRSPRKIAWEDLGAYEVRTYNAFGDYGGWGIRYGREGKAYNVSGNRGVQLELSNGERMLIGSRKAEELARAIDSARSRRRNPER